MTLCREAGWRAIASFTTTRWRADVVVVALPMNVKEKLNEMRTRAG